MTGHALARLALLADALLAASVLCVPGRPRRIAAIGALVLTPVLLAGELWHSTQVTHLRHHPALALGGVLAAIVVVGALALAVRSRPQVLALLAVLALPFRFSFLAGGTGGILIPLYVVIAAGTVAFLFEGGDRDPAAGTLERALGAFVVLYAIQALYTPAASLSKAVEDAGFFLVPFSLLYVLLRRARWDRALLARCARAVVALAVFFVAVAALEYASRRLLFNTALNANAALLPRQLAVLRPEHLRPLPGVDDGARGRGGALGGASAARGGRRGGARGAVARAAGDGLAVQHRRAAGRARGARRRALLAALDGGGGHGRARRRCRRRAARLRQPAPEQREQRDERPGAPRQHRHRSLRRPAARRLRLRLVLLRVPHATPGTPARTRRSG